MNSPISRMGGKKLLVPQLLKRFPEKPPDKYVEVFGGAGWLLFASDRHAPLEVFNDVDGELVNLFRCMKYHAGELQREIRWVLNSREMFTDAKEQQACRGFTDIQRAAQYFLIVKLSYGSDARTYGGSKKNLTKAREYLTAVQQRLEGVRIEHKDFQALIKQFDGAGTLFFLDPPYLGAEDSYDAVFTIDDHLRLRDALRALKGQFLLTYNDDPQVWEWYRGFQIETVDRNNNLTGRYQSTRQDSKYHELIIRNY